MPSGLAFGAESLARTSVALLYFEEDRYRLLARNMSDVISRHSRNGAVQFISPAAEAMLGAPVARLQGHGLFDRVHVADRPAYLTALSDAARGGEARSVEFRLRRDSGGADRTIPPIHLGRNALPPVRAGHSGEAEVVAVMRDVTDRKMQEQALEQARIAAEQADASKTRFLATMSHELRTPLNAIIGFSEMIDAGRSADARRRAPQGIRAADQRFRPASVVGRQRHSRHVEDGIRQLRDCAGAVRAARRAVAIAAICWR